MKKAWEAMALFVVVIIFVSIVSDAIQPFLPVIGIVVSFLVVATAVIFLARLVVSKRRFW